MVEMAEIPDDARGLGEWLAHQREAAGLTQAQLAQNAGVSARTVQRWESGKHAPADVIRVLTALGVRLDPPAPDSVTALNVTLEKIGATLNSVEGRLESPSVTFLRRLEAIEDRLDDLPTGEQLKQGLDAIRRSIDQASLGTAEAGPAAS